MKNVLLACGVALLCGGAAMAETVTIGGTEYTVERKIDRVIGPGTTHLRLRLPDYPLNVNVLMVDVTNPYNRIETTVAKESSRGTESLVTAATRQSYEGHRALAGANANFWIVGSQPEGAVLSGITRNVSLRNGKLITESNQHRDQWDGGTMRTGIVGLSYDRQMYVQPCSSTIKVWSDKFSATEVHQCNKGVWSDEMAMYNSHYGSATAFIPLCYKAGTNEYAIDTANDATEVLLDFAEGGEWLSGAPMQFVVKEVRTEAGHGCIGDHDLALVGRGDNASTLALLAAGDVVSLEYNWTFDPNGEAVTPRLEQAVGGNALVMLNGELLDNNYNETYNSQVYSRTGYGCSADGKTLYIIVIDKSSDPVYGTSKGCPTSVMCEIAKWLGCDDMANFDAGGSAEMMVNGAIENKTTEGTPRAVANGWIVYSIAPEDDPAPTPARLEFYDVKLTQPIYASATPAVIAYDQYGAVISYAYTDITFTCDEAIGTCSGNVFTAGNTAAVGTLTAHCGDVSVSKQMTVVGAEVAIRCPNILIDGHREYPIEVEAVADGKTYAYDTVNVSWTVADPTVATVDANGVLRGVSEGVTTITGSIGEFTSEATVTVEIAPAAEMDFAALNTYNIKVPSGITDVEMADDGLISFTYGSARAPYIELSCDDDFYSLPDGVYTRFTPSLAVSGVLLAVVPANESREVVIRVEPDEGFAGAQEHRVDFDLSEAFNPADMACYPVAFKRMRFTIKPDNSAKGACSLAFGGLVAEYAHYDAVKSVAVDLAPSRLLLPAVDCGAQVVINLPNVRQVNVYTVAGAQVANQRFEGADTAAIAAPAVPGTYVVTATTQSGRHSGLLIVK